jgi:hypothetical protein
MPATNSAYSDLTALAGEFWSWRALTQPLSGDDIPRIERPARWTPDWSPEAVAQRQTHLDGFEKRWKALGEPAGSWPVTQQVDYRLIGSALARVRWELDVVQGWRRNPLFYVHQTLGAIFEALLQPPPFDGVRSDGLVRRAESIPATLEAARLNLADHAVGPFAVLALDAIRDIRPRLKTVDSGLSTLLDPSTKERFSRAIDTAATALEDLGEWLQARLSSMPTQTAIGRQNYVSFLQKVALVPLTPEQIVAAGEQELERAIAFEAFELYRNRDLAPLSLPKNVEEQIAREAAGEQMLREFCEEHGLLTFPTWLRRYRNLPLPTYLAPLRHLGVTDDLTSASRLDQDGTCYLPDPSPDLPYFYQAMARDPRTLIAHEGVHYYQLALSWAHENPIRRQYYDSGPNEGIGFYAEEMLLQAGLFDDSPRSREIIYNFMRLRALRVAVDVRLALGELTIDTAADELARRVPMDAATAREEASLFASEPGQAITYQIGKLQILRFLAQSRAAKGDAFDLRTFHDALWINGNVPIALQAWESLGVPPDVF